MSDPAEIITSTLGGKTFPSCRFCAYHLQATIARLARRFTDDTLVVIQPPFNTTVSASAGTHDKCSAFDVQIVGMFWTAAQRFLRESGWAAWYRPAQAGLWSDHIHMVSLGCCGPKGDLIPGQVADYHSHRTGLAGHEPDPSWFPPDIDSMLFDYDAWEAKMPLNSADLKAISDLIDARLGEWGKIAGDAIRVPSADGKTKQGLGPAIQKLLKACGK